MRRNLRTFCSASVLFSSRPTSPFASRYSLMSCTGTFVTVLTLARTSCALSVLQM